MRIIATPPPKQDEDWYFYCDNCRGQFAATKNELTISFFSLKERLRFLNLFHYPMYAVLTTECPFCSNPATSHLHASLSDAECSFIMRIPLENRKYLYRDSYIEISDQLFRHLGFSKPFSEEHMNIALLCVESE